MMKILLAAASAAAVFAASPALAQDTQTTELGSTLVCDGGNDGLVCAPQPASTRTYTATVEIDRDTAERLCRANRIARSRLRMGDMLGNVAAYAATGNPLFVTAAVTGISDADRFCAELEQPVTPMPAREDEPHGTRV